ncbi:hypothetical protein V2G26_007456 [Clonostachys chloroleuca]|uniref:Uncharacterized protein n=1 Tax=Clonostachys chloroleuca TaxID=1926264 RepID=A0AA35Q5I7_9HYPO|nr:unnamed protein product [Clonostachys chloroleuca]
MHPTKTIISLLAIAGFAQADRLNSREVDVAREQYLVARDEYIQKRSLYLRNAPSHSGYCNKAQNNSKTLYCLSRKTGTVCGVCKPNAKVMENCQCPGL